MRFRESKGFKSIQVLIDWYNYIKPHMSLDWTMETPAKAFVKKMSKKVVVKKHTQKEYHVSKRQTDFGIQIMC